MKGQIYYKIMIDSTVSVPPVYGPGHVYCLMYPMMGKALHASRKPTIKFTSICQPQFKELNRE